MTRCRRTNLCSFVIFLLLLLELEQHTMDYIQSWCGFSSEHVFLDEKEGSAVSHAIVMFSRAPLLVVTWLLVKAI